MKSNNPTTSRKSSELVEAVLNKFTREWVAPTVVVLVTCATFLPVIWNHFVDWDDDSNLINNPHYRGLGWSQLRWMFTTFHMGPYQPLSWVTLGLDYLIWGMNPVGYHLTNLFLHAANAAFFYFISRRLLAFALTLSDDKRSWRLNLTAALAALLFAIHPLRVESVAWATERRDVLSGFFFLWTIYCYLRAASGARNFRLRWLCAAVIVYALSLLSKATAITLPALLVVLDVYPLRRLQGRLIDWVKPRWRSVLWEKLPFLALALVFSVVAFIGQHSARALMLDYNVVSWLGPPFYGLNFYVWKTLLPLHLSPIYEFPYDSRPWLAVYGLCAISALAVSIGFFRLRRRWPAPLACWLYYLISLLPVLGIVRIGPQLVADRFSYLTCLSWAVLVGGAVFLYCLPSADQASSSQFMLFTTAVVTVGTIFILSFLTWRQIGVWRDAQTFWQYAIAVSPASSIGHYKFGNVLFDHGKVDEAIESYRRAVTLNPGRAAYHYGVARGLARKGQQGEAIVNYRKALEIDPQSAQVHYSLGSLLGMRGDVEEAQQHLQEAVKLKPDYAEAYSNLGNVLSMQGKTKDAVQDYRRSLEIDPSFDDTRFNLGMALLHLGDFTGAAEQFQLILKKRPDFAQAHFLLGNAFAARGLMGEAIEEFRRTVDLTPNSADGHEALGRALAMTGKVDEATQHYQRALALLKSQRDSAKNTK